MGDNTVVPDPAKLPAVTAVSCTMYAIGRVPGPITKISTPAEILKAAVPDPSLIALIEPRLQAVRFELAYDEDHVVHFNTADVGGRARRHEAALLLKTAGFDIVCVNKQCIRFRIKPNKNGGAY